MMNNFRIRRQEVVNKRLVPMRSEPNYLHFHCQITYLRFKKTSKADQTLNKQPTTPRRSSFANSATVARAKLSIESTERVFMSVPSRVTEPEITGSRQMASSPPLNEDPFATLVYRTPNLLIPRSKVTSKKRSKKKQKRSVPLVIRLDNILVWWNNLDLNLCDRNCFYIRSSLSLRSIGQNG